MNNTNSSANDLAQEFIKLGLAAWQHNAEFVDAYFGPSEWLQQAQAEGALPLKLLIQKAEALLESIDANNLMDSQRREYLAGEIRALITGLRSLAGETMAYSEEVKGLYDITPEWVDESIFEQALDELNELLPGNRSTGRAGLLDRRERRQKQASVNLNGETILIKEIAKELRRRTAAQFPLPSGESFDVELVSEKHWGAYNQYLGNLHSLIYINIDRPLTATRLVTLMAHEGYPGHHTELANKESALIQGKGWIEHCLVLTQAPSAIIAEGIATQAAVIDETLVDWCQQELFPKLGLDALDAGRELAIERVSFQLAGVPCNAAIMLHDQGKSQEDVLAYIQRYGLGDEKRAQGTVNFIRQTGSYVFTYWYGWHMLDELFRKQGDRLKWFRRLLSEPVTPEQLRRWKREGNTG